MFYRLGDANLRVAACQKPRKGKQKRRGPRRPAVCILQNTRGGKYHSGGAVALPREMMVGSAWRGDIELS